MLLRDVKLQDKVDLEMRKEKKESGTSAKIGKKIVKVLDGIVNWTVLATFLIFLLVGFYAIWDADQVFKIADYKQYQMYKPTADDGDYSFAQLYEINPDVFAWLTVYGTNIDYPIVQTDNNDTYLNKNPLKEFSLAGSLFVDFRSGENFSDFSTIVYGHHMDKNAMFGELEKFRDRQFFDEHLYGNLYISNKDYGVQFFAFMEVDAYDADVYRVNVSAERVQDYLAVLLSKASNTREISIEDTDRIVLLSTCTSDSTNGRHILIGKITDDTYEDVFAEDKTITEVDTWSLWGILQTIPWWVYAIIIIAVLFLVDRIRRRGKHEKKK